MPVSQSTRQMITRKKSCGSSDSSELKYRTILFENIKHVSIFIHFSHSTDQLKVFLSLLYPCLLQPLGCLRLDFFIEKISVVFLCVPAITYFLI